MATKIGRNEKCHCGSGKKYKKCCLMKEQEKPAFQSQEEWNEWVEEVSNLPFRAEITSMDGSEGSMKVSSAKIIKDGKEEVLFEDEIELKTNSVDGDKIKESTAIFIAPQKDEAPKVISFGNASVTNEKEVKQISLFDNKKKMKTESDSGHFASAKIGLQINSGLHYFQLFFGVSGKKEIVGESGTKDRPHIDFYPSGNGKYIRLSEYKCKLETKSGYEKDGKIIFPSKARIELEDYNEYLELEFTYENDVATLQSMNFKTKHNKS
jgi:SEC-C motif